MESVIRLSGKAKQVFEFMRLVAKAHPNKTLGDMCK